MPFSPENAKLPTDRLMTAEQVLQAALNAAQNGIKVDVAGFPPVLAADGGAHRTLPVGSAATNTASVELAATCGHVQIQVETANVRMTVNGTTPTASIGIRLAVGQSVLMSRAEWDAAKFIREATTDALIQVAQYN